MSVDLPAPFGPTSAMRSPRSIMRSRPFSTTFSPYTFRVPLSSSTMRPGRLASGKWKWIFFRSGGISIRSTLSRSLIRLWTCFAFVAV